MPAGMFSRAESRMAEGAVPSAQFMPPGGDDPGRVQRGGRARRPLGEGVAEMNNDFEQRFIALETRLSHHERMAEELSDVVARQARTIEILTAQIRHLRERVAELADMGARSPRDDKPPPHY